MSKRTKQILISVGAILVVIALLAFPKFAQFGAMMEAGESWAPPPEAVTTTNAQGAEWNASLVTVGTLVAVQGVTIASEVPGTVKDIAFESGGTVKKGDLLVRLDASVERAQLASAESSARLADLDLARAKKLRKAGATSDSQLDTAEARAAQARADVRNVRAAIAKKTIRAPFSGRLGIRQVNLGEIVQPGAAIVGLQSYDPIYVDFRVPQQSLAEMRVGDTVLIVADTFPDTHWEGKVKTIDSQVDTSTRNVRVRAVVGNADGRLVPGMFVDVQTVFSEQRSVVTIPESAVLYAPYGDSVFIVNTVEGEESQSIVERKFVRLGERRGDIVEVTSGLQVGQEVVSTGAFKLRNEMKVVVKNELAPSAKTDPSPTNQ